jgi:hypothetical protein
MMLRKKLITRNLSRREKLPSEMIEAIGLLITEKNFGASKHDL